MFDKCSSLVEFPDLPVTTLADDCYNFMFRYCSGLAKAPALPATELSAHCYDGMFLGCSSLTEGPELPATTLVDGCYTGMFYKCTSLTKVKVAFTSWLEYATDIWFFNASPTGTFICPEGLPVEIGVDRIPEGWIVENTHTGTEHPLAAGQCSVVSSGLTIFVSGADAVVEVYDALGRMVDKNIGKEEQVVFYVPRKGVYLVRIGSQTYKVEL